MELITGSLLDRPMSVLAITTALGLPQTEVAQAVNFLRAGGHGAQLLVRLITVEPAKEAEQFEALVGRILDALSCPGETFTTVCTRSGEFFTYTIRLERDYPPEVIDGDENIIKVTLVHSGADHSPDPDLAGDREAHESLGIMDIH